MPILILQAAFFLTLRGTFAVLECSWKKKRQRGNSSMLLCAWALFIIKAKQKEEEILDTAKTHAHAHTHQHN